MRPSVLVAFALACCVPSAPARSSATAAATVVGAPASAGAAAAPAGHDGRCTAIDFAPEEVVARLFIFVGQHDQRAIADCFARAYLLEHADAPARWAVAGPVRKFGFTRLRAAEDAPRIQVTAELVAGVDSWRGLATHVLALRRDPDRWAIAGID